MNWLQSIIYAFFSGMAEFLPVSSGAHQSIFCTIFGQMELPIALNFTTHLGALAAVYINCQSHLTALGRTQRLLAIPMRRRKRQPDKELVAELRIFRSGSIVAVLMVFLLLLAYNLGSSLHILAILLLINGLVLFVSGRISIGNKTAGSMTRFDSILIGFSFGLGVFPGLSRMGMGMSVGAFRGAAHKNTLSWGLLISIPVLCALCVADIVAMFAIGVSGFGFISLLQCLFGAVFSYIGATLSILFLRFIAVKTGFYWISYYSWGLAFFVFLLYMI